MRSTIAAVVAGALLARLRAPLTWLMALLATAAMCTAGCASAAGQPVPSADGLGKITFAIGSDDINWLRPVIAKWNAIHPGQAVTALYLPQAANVQLDQLVANLQAKSPVYDVIDMDVVWTAEFAANGWIIPLPESKFPLGDFIPSAVKTAKYQSRLYAVPDYSNAGLLYYRRDILTKAHQQPPTTWAQLKYLAKTVAPRYGLAGYAGTFAQYEGLTVNFAEAVQSAGGSILNPSDTQVTVDSPQALAGLQFLVDGFRQGWIPRSTLRYEEVAAQEAFESGRFLFLNDWPDVYATLGPDANRTYGIAALPGPGGPGSSSLGGANLAISAFSQHQGTALSFIQYLTEYDQQKTMLELGSFPPVLESLYHDPSLTARFPYLPTLYQAIKSAQPRPAITSYDQASLVIFGETYQALEGQKTPRQALADMQKLLTQVVRSGLTPPLAEQGPARYSNNSPTQIPIGAIHT
ncbi:MAG: ABC transporter substrate-binding protein [Streptosporangiaceae bacterium]|nr:ABC transporter substrate-binding protein [Streptosporangiaceae bacterium]